LRDALLTALQISRVLRPVQSDRLSSVAGDKLRNSGPAVRQHPGPGTESLSLDALRLSPSTTTGGGSRDKRRARANATRRRSREERDVEERGREAAREGPSGLLVLAAVERAQRHRAAAGAGASRREIDAHLELRPRTAAARAAHATLQRLTAQGALRRERRRGVWAWSVTASGRAWLARASRASAFAALPESPQHRAWRDARARAASALDLLVERLRRDLRDAARLLAAPEDGARSDAWFELAERLSRDAWRVGSATYCLHEWPEPPEARADVDTRREPADESLPRAERERRRARRAGRRNLALWED
jgi:hypothetical protein